MTSSPVILLDCTLRDGGYYNHWDFSPELIASYLQAMAAIPVDFVEIGFRSFEQHGFKGGAAYSTDAWIRSLPIPPGLRIGVMVNAAELVSHSEGVVPALQKLFAPAGQSPVSLVRLACHALEYQAVLPGCAWLKAQGYLVGLNLMQVAGMTDDEVAAIAADCSAYPLDVLYFADSLGSMAEADVSRVIRAMRQHWRGALGLHTHDNMTRALANCLCGVSAGASWLDCTVTGMGRGAGNVKTEYLALALPGQRVSPERITPLLSVIARYFAPLQALHGWGANPYYYLAGQYGIHPTYIQQMLSDSRYTDTDMLAVIEHLRSVGAQHFSADSLETARHFYQGEVRGTWSPAEVLQGREVLILGPGPGLAAHKQAVEQYIRHNRPYVIALNTQTVIDAACIDARAACHPVRLLADCAQYQDLPQPLITPASMLPESLVRALSGKTLLDFGLAVASHTFGFFAHHAVAPTSLVVAYAMAVASSGRASRILLAGFDGYGADDPRSAEMDDLLEDYRAAAGALPLLSITPSRYKVDVGSVYAMISPSS